KVVVTPTQTVFAEGRCMSAVEALYCGTPVIAPDFGPFPFLVKHGQNGLLYQPDSIPDLRAKLEQLWSDNEGYQKMAAGARQTADELRADPSPDFETALRAALERVGCLSPSPVRST